MRGTGGERKVRGECMHTHRVGVKVGKREKGKEGRLNDLF